MGLRAKFNLVLLAAFVVGLALSATVSYRVVHDNAQREVAHEAEIMITAASAIRDYTAKEIKPLLIDQMKLRFLPHTVSAWAARSNLRTVSAQFPDYSYKEAALNPTNPADLATDWEADIIAEFQHTATLKEFTSVRDTPNGPMLSVSRPLRIVDSGCLTCHTSAAEAPPPWSTYTAPPTALAGNWATSSVRKSSRCPCGSRWIGRTRCSTSCSAASFRCFW